MVHGQRFYLLRSCYEINYTDCAGWFFEIKEENAAVQKTQPYRGTARLSDEEIGKPDKQDV